MYMRQAPIRCAAPRQEPKDAAVQLENLELSLKQLRETLEVKKTNGEGILVAEDEQTIETVDDLSVLKAPRTKAPSCCSSCCSRILHFFKSQPRVLV